MKLNNDIFRQGDVILVYRETNSSAKTVEPGQACILAFGEVTGHKHQLRSKAKVVTPPINPVFDVAAERYLQLLDSSELSHEEHDIVKLRAGVIEIGVQVEAGPGNMLHRVAD